MMERCDRHPPQRAPKRLGRDPDLINCRIRPSTVKTAALRAAAHPPGVPPWGADPARRDKAPQLSSRHDGDRGIVTDHRPVWPPPGPPAYIVIYPDSRSDRWRHAEYGSDMGFIDGYFDLPASVSPAQAMHAAEAMLADWGRKYYDLHFAIEWHDPDAKGWIPGDVRGTQAQSAERLES